MRLANGTVWPIPVVLDVPEGVADRLEIGQRVSLVDGSGRVAGVLALEEKFEIEPGELARRLAGTNGSRSPEAFGSGGMHRTVLAGAVEWIPQRERDPLKAYDLTPRQVRRLFEERSWTSVAAFQSYNIPNLAHEHIQRRALDQSECDGLFLHPVVGEKRSGDFEDRAIITCHERLIGEWDPPDQAVFATFRGLPRFEGLRGLLLAAVCRKNFGCSHFATGVGAWGDSLRPDSEVLDELRGRFPDLGVEVIGFGPIGYSTRDSAYREADGPAADAVDWEPIHSAEVRSLLQQGVAPPGWMVRPSVSAIVLDAHREGRAAFAEADSAGAGAQHE
jgi:ATP sulfurylase